jgi:hypothetical protein
MLFDLLLTLGMVLVTVVTAFAVSALVGWTFAPHLRGPERPAAGQHRIPTRPPGG